MSADGAWLFGTADEPIRMDLRLGAAAVLALVVSDNGAFAAWVDTAGLWCADLALCTVIQRPLVDPGPAKEVVPHEARPDLAALGWLDRYRWPVSKNTRTSVSIESACGPAVEWLGRVVLPSLRPGPGACSNG